MDSLATIQQLGSGRLLRDMADHLAAVSEDVLRTGNKGAVTVTITVERWKDTGMVAVAGVVKPQPPAEKAAAAMFYPHEGGLYRDDPNQLAMQFEVVDTATGAVKTVDENGEIREAK